MSEQSPDPTGPGAPETRPAGPPQHGAYWPPPPPSQPAQQPSGPPGQWPGGWGPPPGPPPPPGAGWQGEWEPAWGQPPAPPAPPRRPGRGWAALLAGVAALALLVGATGLAAGWALGRNVLNGSAISSNSPIHLAPQIVPGSQSGGNADAQAVASKVDPAVVDINTVVAGLRGSARAAGTGMILTSSGEVLTNNHVVQDATSIQVSIQGRSGTYTATAIGVDPAQDVALLQIQNVSGLPTVTLADSSRVTQGQSIVAIGNALGQGGTPTATQGSVTGLDQDITASDGGGSAENLTGLIQIDAPISPGDSGGPVVNAAGQVIGMITAGQTTGFRQSTSTTGFAIPSSTALDVVNQIRAGRAGNGVIIGQSGHLGVGVQNLDPATAAQLGLNAGSGVLVTGVTAGSPADRAGIAANSVITAINGSQVSSTTDLGAAIQSHRPGEQIRVTWVDQTGTHDATVTLTTGPVA